MDNKGTVIAAVLSVLLIAAIVFFGFTPGGRAIVNGYRTTMKKVDETIFFPLSGIILNIFPNSLIIFFISDDMVMEISLPYLLFCRLRHCPFHAPNDMRDRRAILVLLTFFQI